MAGVMLALRSYFAEAFTRDTATVSMATDVLRLVAGFHVSHMLF